MVLLYPHQPVSRIPLTNKDGVFTLVDRADARWLRQWKWRLDSRGYAYTRLDGGRVEMHRLLMQPEPGQSVDHRNGIRLDNRRENLRFATRLENLVNRTKRTKTQSRYVGVRPSANGKKWIARVGGGGTHVGVYPTAIEAARARDKAAMQRYGEWVTLNVAPTPERSALRKAMVVLPERRRARRSRSRMRRVVRPRR